MTTRNSRPKVEVLPNEASTPFDDKTSDNSNSDSNSDNSDSDSNSNSDNSNSNGDSDNSGANSTTCNKKEETSYNAGFWAENADTIRRIQIEQARQYIKILKSKSDDEAIKIIKETLRCDLLQIGLLIESKKAKDALKKELGDKVANFLIDCIGSDVEELGRESNSASRIQSLEEDTEGFGVYARKTPHGTIGAEAGFVHAQKEGDSLKTQRLGLGIYINCTTRSKVMYDEETEKKIAEEIKSFFA